MDPGLALEPCEVGRDGEPGTPIARRGIFFILPAPIFFGRLVVNSTSEALQNFQSSFAARP